MDVNVTLFGNSGFEIQAGGFRLLIDAFTNGYPGGTQLDPPAESVQNADLILITHSHYDHFSPWKTAAAARVSGAQVVGPKAVIDALAGELPAGQLVEAEPPVAPAGQPAAAVELTSGPAKITAFRTFHARGHNSYLIDVEGVRLFHDGDNEDTRRLDLARLGRNDALFLCPWKGSGWVEFIERLNPNRWFLMHLTDAELDDHEAGRFFADICDYVPLADRLVVLRPGQTHGFAVGG